MPKSKKKSIVIVLNRPQQLWLEEILEQEIEYFQKIGSDRTNEEGRTMQMHQRLLGTLQEAMEAQN